MWLHNITLCLRIKIHFSLIISPHKIGVILFHPFQCVLKNGTGSFIAYAVSASVSVFQVTGCFPSPRIHRFRISRVMLMAFSWYSEVICSTIDPSSSFSRMSPRSVYCVPTLCMMLILSPVLVGRLISWGRVSP